ncbi:MAG: hypothetical protein AUI11_00500 [Acidobacteria bacterium 13_2_20CM_2_66_4]|nr:MAG: hypothetical protein AUI11_00500 [Acidobacteria bacterium 13_2_20CM_2_66_4]
MQAIADVARNLRCADHSALVVPNRRDRERNRNERAILAAAPRFVVFDRVSASDAAQDLLFFREPLRRDDERDRAADDFAGRVAEHALGRGVPRLHDAVQVLADDRVVRGGDDRSEPVRVAGAPRRN